MKKIIYVLLSISLIFTIAGCGKKCDEGYTQDGDYCVSNVSNNDLLHIEYVCDGEWHLEGTECVQGTMPTIGDGCEVGTTDRVGEDGFCHHYKEAEKVYSCLDDAILKDNKCYSKKDLK